ncbi:MAG: AsnC family protein [Gammaproteobacteria bacterium HGW-Gammaproteobacteria-3]|nr:MAG: AsnC family protein [Gammaproteobacteria bacterium HGW-Gammaproteobacteria-3]
MDELDTKIINTLQLGFPVCASPYRQVAGQLGITEAKLLARLENLLANGTLTRFGPLFHAEQMGGALTLAAVSVPVAEFDKIAGIINAFPEVAHNYAREHTLNMWFVIATETPQQLTATLAAIARQTGLTVYNMPKKREYFVNLKLEA